jgi:hypothetical protein
VRYVQTLAQKTKVFVSIQVYILLIKLYFTVLDYGSPLKIYDPAIEIPKQTNKFIAYDIDQESTGEKQADELDSRATTVRQKLRDALFDRYFKRYHPHKAYCKVQDFFPKKNGTVPREIAEKEDFHYSFL